LSLTQHSHRVAPFRDLRLTILLRLGQLKPVRVLSVEGSPVLAQIVNSS
jgi:hypothetical protein